MRVVAEQTNPSESIYHALKNDDGWTAFCGYKTSRDADRFDASHIDRQQRCGLPACQRAFQEMHDE